MQPNNHAERRKASLNFMLLFLLCTAIIITTVFFSTRIPFTQNKKLVEEKNSFTQRDEFKSNFTDRLTEVSSMIDSLGNKTSGEISIYATSIDKKVDELGALLKTASAEDAKLYTTVMTNLNRYYDAKKAAKKGIETSSNEKEYQEQIEKLQDRNLQLYTQLSDCVKGK